MTLKIAGYEDIPDIKRMGLNFYAASLYGFIPYDEQKIDQGIKELLDADKTERIVILSCREKPVGMIAGVIQEFMFNRSRIALELFWWMDPEYRNSRDSIKLVEAYEYWATNIAKAQIVQLSLLTTEQAPSIEKFYTRRGYRLSEKSYFKELVNASN